MNAYLFNLINGLACKSGILDRIMILFSTLVPLIFMVVLGGAYFYGIIKKIEAVRCTAVDTLVITAVGLLISYFIGYVYFVKRPFAVGKVNLLIPHAADASFPSDHAIGTMSIALGISNSFKLLGRVLIVLSLVVAFSRVYVGHHFPFDVLGGIAISLIVKYLYRKMLSSRMHKMYMFCERSIIKVLPFRA